MRRRCLQKFPQIRPSLASGFSRNFDPTTFNDVDLRFVRNSRIAKPEQFDRYLSRERQLEFSRPFEPFLYRRAKKRLLGTSEPRPGDTRPWRDWFQQDQQKLIESMAHYLRVKNLPVLVVHLPYDSYPEQCQAFAKILGAQLVDGGQAFAELNSSEFKQCWMPDGHWNQRGSDRFAKFMVQTLGRWNHTGASSATE